MLNSYHARTTVIISYVALTASCGPMAHSGPTPAALEQQAVSDTIRATERDRLRALVAGDSARASQLHADNFQLINPAGGAISKKQYLDGIGSGQIDYLYWEPDSIAVRVHDDAAVIRYRSQLEIVVQGRHIPRQAYWHTDFYERQQGRWQIVWSQATAIQ